MWALSLALNWKRPAAKACRAEGAASRPAARERVELRRKSLREGALDAFIESSLWGNVVAEGG
jgi:hypothetical protein